MKPPRGNAILGARPITMPLTCPCLMMWCRQSLTRRSMPVRCPPRLLNLSQPKRLLSSGRCPVLVSQSWSPIAVISFVPALGATPDSVHPKHLSTAPFTDYSVILGRIVSIGRRRLFGLRCLFLFRHSRVIDLRYDASSGLCITGCQS